MGLRHVRLEPREPECARVRGQPRHRAPPRAAAGGITRLDRGIHPALVHAALAVVVRAQQLVHLDSPAADLSRRSKTRRRRKGAGHSGAEPAGPRIVFAPARGVISFSFMSFPIVQVDAFTAEPFAGNPAAVCMLPAARDPGWMQDVAREMNLSETAFLHPEQDGYRLRWFTPATEVALCGHATLA